MEECLGYQQDGHCIGYDGLVPSFPVPRRLQWEFPPACVARIHSARKFAEEQIADLELYVLVHDAFGKGVMKKCKISPDAFIQMALQMAYYKVCLHPVFACCVTSLPPSQDAGKFRLTYEASMTRLYLQGRTETVRPVTKYSCQFVRAMCDPSLKDTMTVSLSSLPPYHYDLLYPV